VNKFTKKGEKLLKLAPSFKFPILIVRGEADIMADPTATQKFFELLGSDNKKLHSVPKLFHDIHNEPEEPQVLQFIVDWILSQGKESEEIKKTVENGDTKVQSKEKEVVVKEEKLETNEIKKEENSSSQQTKPGKRSAADFEFIKVLGHGAFGEVKLAREIKTNEEFAVKVLEKKQMTTEDSKKKVFTERNVFNMLNHPNIVKLTYTFQDPKFLYFVIELCPNGDLLQHLKKVGKFNEVVTRFYSAEIINALEHMHSKGILHRDLKPDNILLDPNMHAKLTDFGTGAILSDGNTRTRSQSFVGTEEYVSPEILDLQDPHSMKVSDLWSLGCMIFQFLAGKPPFKAETAYQTFELIRRREFTFPQDFPPVAKDLVDKLLMINPNERLGCGPSGYADIKTHPFFFNSGF